MLDRITKRDAVPAIWAAILPIPAKIAADLPPRAELYRRHQLGRLAAQGGGQALDRLDPHRPLAALDQADVRAMKLGGIRQGLLGQTPVLPGLPDPTAEHDGVIAARHA